MLTSSATSKTNLKLEQQLCFDLYSASLAMTKVYKPLLASLGLTYPQYIVMLVLWEAGDLMVSEIGARLYLDSGTLTPLLKRLELSGLISRERDAQDERRVRIKLTQQGQALQAKAASIPACVAAQAQAPLKELRSLSQNLKSLRTHLLS
jgi:DNA-binding MarR family transcriptional regulator